MMINLFFGIIVVFIISSTCYLNARNIEFEENMISIENYLSHYRKTVL